MEEVSGCMVLLYCRRLFPMHTCTALDLMIILAHNGGNVGETVEDTLEFLRRSPLHLNLHAGIFEHCRGLHN